MRRWIQDILGRWAAERYRIRKLREAYRTYERNKALLENGGTL